MTSDKGNGNGWKMWALGAAMLALGALASWVLGVIYGRIEVMESKIYAVQMVQAARVPQLEQTMREIEQLKKECGARR